MKTPQSSKNTQQILTLGDRAILGIEAATLNAAKTFLQPLLSQNTGKLSAQNLLYSAMLTPQGRLITDLFLFVHPKNSNTLCLDVPKSQLMSIAQKLNQNTLGQNIIFHDNSQEVTISAILSEKPEDTEEVKKEAKTEQSLTALDPRRPELGHRYYAFTPPLPENKNHLQTYHSHRISHGIPDVFYDAPPQKALPAELNLQHLNAIDFNKGCYVGQEVTARLHYKSAAKKALYHADITAAPTSENNTTPITKPNTTSEIGWHGKPFNGQALAVIQTRIDPKTLPHLNLTLPSYLPRANISAE